MCIWRFATCFVSCLTTTVLINRASYMKEHVYSGKLNEMQKRCLLRQPCAVFASDGGPRVCLKSQQFLSNIVRSVQARLEMPIIEFSCLFHWLAIDPPF